MRRLVGLLNLRQLRRQPVRTLLATLAIAAGVAMAGGVGVAIQSLSTSLASFASDLSGPTPIRVLSAQGRGGITPDLVEAVRATPGVGIAAPTIQTVVIAGGAHEVAVVALGVDCTIEEVVGHFGCSDDAVRTAADDAPPLIGAALLDDLGGGAHLRTDLGVIPLDAAPTSAELDGINDGHIAVFPLPQAQRALVRGDQVDVVYVRPAADVPVGELRDRLAVTVGDRGRVLLADEAPPVVGSVEFLLPFLGIVGLIAIALGALVVFNTMELSLQERRRELAVASALGARGRQLVVGALTESAVMGFLGATAGAAAAPLVALPLVRNLSAETERGMGAVISLHVRPSLVAGAVAAGVAVAVLAGWLPARRAARVDVIGELQRRAGGVTGPHRLRLRLPLALTAVGALGLVLGMLAQADGGLEGWQPAAGQAGLLLTIGGLFAAVGAWTPIVLGHLVLVLRHLPVRLRLLPLALANLANQPARTAAVAASIGIAVGLGSGLGNFIPASRAGIEASFGDLVDGRLAVSTTPITSSSAVDSKVSPAMIEAIEDVDGVAGVDRSFSLTTILDDEATTVGVVEHGPYPWPVLEGDDPRAVFERGEVMIGAGSARAEGLRAGDAVRVASPDGPVELAVGGVWENPDNFGLNVTVPSAEVFLGRWGPQPPDTVFVRPDDGVSVATLAGRLRAADLGPGVTVHTPNQYTRELADEVGSFIGPFWALQRTLLVAAFIATVATLLLVGVQRRREHALMSAIGAGPRALRRLLLLEGGLVGAVASVLGVVASVGAVIAFVQVGALLFGLRPPMQLDLRPGLLYAAVGTALVLAGAAWPAYRASLVHPVRELRYE